MKNMFLTLSMGVAAMLTACNTTPAYQISGHLDGIATDTLLVMVTDADYTRTERIDTVPMDNGDFGFNLPEQEMRSVVLVPMPEAGKKTFEDGYISIAYMPDDYLTVGGTIEEPVLDGTGFYAELKAAQTELPPYETAFKELAEECEKRMADGESKDSVQAYYQEKATALSEENANAVKEYIAKHPDSDVSVYLLGSMGERMGEGLALLTDRAKEGPASGLYKALKNRQEAEEKRKEAAGKIQPGMEAPDFTLMDLNGKPLSLSSLRGKYVVLDFWGSWCGWCIKGFPEMKKYYAKYKNKMEFLGVACGDTEKKWKAAVAKHEVPWLNVINEKGEKDVSAAYGISGYPTKIVIDPKGKIAKVVVGEDPAFYTYLDELFK